MLPARGLAVKGELALGARTLVRYRRRPVSHRADSSSRPKRPCAISANDRTVVATELSSQETRRLSPAVTPIPNGWPNYKHQGTL